MVTITRNWENDGALEIHGATTLDTYFELREKQRNFDMKGKCFFAFSKEQFEQGCKDINLKEGEKVCQTRHGMFGRKEDIDWVFAELAKIDKEIAEKCDPQEVYFYEWNNHECMYTDDDTVMGIIRVIWGDERAKSIKRVF